MQKDYQLVSSAMSETEELQRIDAFWTDRWAKLHIATSSFSETIEQSDEFKTIADQLLTLAPGSRILDGGCGMGQWVMYLTQRGFQVTGVDISALTIERLRTEFAKEDWLVGDIRHLNHTDNFFDAYISWGTFEHFEGGLLSPIQEAYRVLKPGGLLFFSVPQDSLRLIGRYFASWSLSRRSSGPHQKFYQWRLTKAELAFELGRENFDIISIAAIAKQEGTSRLFHALTGRAPTGPITSRIVKALSVLLPGVLVGHMILAVARKQ